MDGIFFSQVDRAIAAAATATQFINVMDRWSERLGRTVRDEQDLGRKAQPCRTVR